MKFMALNLSYGELRSKLKLLWNFRLGLWHKLFNGFKGWTKEQNETSYKSMEMIRDVMTYRSGQATQSFRTGQCFTDLANSFSLLHGWAYNYSRTSSAIIFSTSLREGITCCNLEFAIPKFDIIQWTLPELKSIQGLSLLTVICPNVHLCWLLHIQCSSCSWPLSQSPNIHI